MSVATPDLRLHHGRYTLVQRLGKGAAGEVWAATDARSGREVAVKLLPGDAGGVAAAEREAEVAVRVRHPNVVEVLQTFEDGGFAGIVMERCAGSLSDEVTVTGPFPPTRACAVLAAVLDGLAAAHGAGVVHRDVKPGNVLLRHDGTVALADWGIARALFGGAGTHTTSAALLGTLPYLAPEIRQDARAATPASDLYAAGITLAWTCTGATPPDPFVPAGEAALQASLPRAIANVVTRACAWAREDRYTSAGEMAEAVREAAGEHAAGRARTRRATSVNTGAEGGPPPSRSALDADLRGRGPVLTAPGAVPPSADASSPRSPLEAPDGANRGGVPSATPPPEGAPTAESRGAAGEVASAAEASVRPSVAPPGTDAFASSSTTERTGRGALRGAGSPPPQEREVHENTPQRTPPTSRTSTGILAGVTAVLAAIAAGVSVWSVLRDGSNMQPVPTKPTTTDGVDALPDCPGAASSFAVTRVMAPEETIAASLADLDADGRLDLIFSNQGGESLTLWWSEAGGLPRARTELAVGRVSGTAAALDVDSDGAPDLVVPHQDAGSFTVHPNLGQRAFGPGVEMQQGPAPTDAWPAGTGRLAFFAMNGLYARERVGGAWRAGRPITDTAGPTTIAWRDGAPWGTVSRAGAMAFTRLWTTPEEAATLGWPNGVPSIARVGAWWEGVGTAARPVAWAGVASGRILRVTFEGACRAGPWSGADLHAVADLDGDGVMDVVASSTCAGCTSNQVLARGVR